MKQTKRKKLREATAWAVVCEHQENRYDFIYSTEKMAIAFLGKEKGEIIKIRITEI